LALGSARKPIGTDIYGYSIEPSYEQYQSIKERFGLKHPGDTGTIVSEWIDGTWVVLPPSLPATFNPEDLKA
jgi:hypothetical protein